MDDYSKLSASDGSGEAVIANIENDRSIGATTLDVDNVDNWPSEFIFVTGTLNANNYIDNASMTIMYGHLDAGNIIIDSYAPGYTDAGNTAGQIAVIKPSTEWVNQVVELARVAHNDDGSLKPSAVEATNPGGWKTGGLTAPTSVTDLGNRSYQVVVPGDNTDETSVGMRLKMTRTVTAPTKCTDLESGSSQYYSKTSPSGVSFTDDYSMMAWIKLESYTGSSQTIIARQNGSTEGWSMYVAADGTLQANGLRIAGNNRTIASYQSIPLNRWVHVAVTMNHSANAHTMYIDGVAVPFSTTTNGTITAIVQGTSAMTVGASNAPGGYFDGKIAQAAVFSSVLSEATILDYKNQTLTGAESSAVVVYSFNNTIEDLTANNNDLTANNGALATSDDTPFTNPVTGTNIVAGTTNFGIITKQEVSTNTTYTVQVPEGETLPTTGGISAVAYSSEKVPYGFPSTAYKWEVKWVLRSNTTQTTPTSSTWYNTTPTSGVSGGCKLTIPLGQWDTDFQAYVEGSGGSASAIYASLSTSSSAAGEGRFTSKYYLNSALARGATHQRRSDISLSVATPYYLNLMSDSSIGSFGILGAQMDAVITARLAYL